LVQLNTAVFRDLHRAQFVVRYRALFRRHTELPWANFAADPFQVVVLAELGALAIFQRARGHVGANGADVVVRNHAPTTGGRAARALVAVRRAAEFSARCFAAAEPILVRDPVEHAARVITLRLVNTVRPRAALPGWVTGPLALGIIKSFILTLGRVVVSAEALISPLDREVLVFQA